MFKAEVFSGVFVRNVFDDISEQFHISWNQAIFDVIAEEVTEDATGILVAREGEGRARIGQHADKVG